MTATVTYHPRLADACDRINARAAAENIAAERAQAIADCKRIIDHPRGYSDAQLREVCGFYMTHGNGGVHYLRADQHIYAINRREWQARNCPRPETPADVARRFAHRWPEILSWGALGALALLWATGWLA